MTDPEAGDPVALSASDPVALSASDPVALVDAYLQACEDRDLDVASRALADDVVLEFPAGARYRSLGELAAAASGRYRFVRKHRDHYAVGHAPDGATVVTSRGRLYGENLHGVAFDDVRYVDVFVLRDGRISEQHVYNDLDASGVLDREV